MVGPLVEIHDATTDSGSAALFGFFGLSRRERAAMGKEALLQACLAQLGYFFGEEGAKPHTTLFKDWAADPLTSTEADVIDGGHPLPTGAPWVSGPWAERLRLCGSETSRREPGYLAGAIDAAEEVITDLVRRLPR